MSIQMVLICVLWVFVKFGRWRGVFVLVQTTFLSVQMKACVRSPYLHQMKIILN